MNEAFLASQRASMFIVVGTLVLMLVFVIAVIALIIAIIRWLNRKDRK
ncbi:hypothetical protein [Treponema socranskii]